MDDLAQSTRLRFEWQAFTLAKDPDYPDENQDVCRVAPERGVAAMADGVSSALFSRLWAEILVEAALDGLPDPDDREAFARWLAGLRELWSRQIDVSRLAWYQKAKLREGAFSTLLYIQLLPSPHSPLPSPLSALASPFAAWRLRGLAMGDSCLFLVREGRLLCKFPIQSSAELDRDPVVIGSVDLNRDQLLEFRRFDEPCRPGDLVVLCTDALAEWALRLEESGRGPAWQDYWDQGQAAWQQEIAALRAERQIRYDDTTLGLLRVTEVSESPGPPPVPAQTPEVASPPPQPPALPSPSEVWVERVRAVSQQVAAQVSEGVARGMGKLREVGHSARDKLKRYVEKLRKDDREED